jgi:hypothetical protein
VETINRVKQRGPLNDKLNSVWLGKERIRRAIANNERAIDEAVLEMALLEDVKRRKVWEKEKPSGCFSDQHYLFARPSGLSDADLVTIASRNPVNVVTLRNISALHWSSEWKAALVRLRCSDITYVWSKGQ